MPRRDGTGPRGAGSMTGRGFGYCATGRGYGLGYGMGYRRGYYPYPYAAESVNKSILEDEKKALQDRLEAINQQLKNTQ